MNIYRGRTHTEVYLASVLYDAIEDQDFSSVTTLLTVKKADPNIVLPGRGISAFHLAIGNDSADFALKVTSLVIQHGGNPNVKSDEGLTPVHIAAAWGRSEILQLLLNCGGDPEITDNCYKNALHYAVDEEHDEACTIIKKFIDHQCVTALGDFWSKIPCHLSLDKIIINSGGVVGKYEVAKPQTGAIIAEDLHKLPQTSSNEYVLNWCNSQVVTEGSRSFEDSNELITNNAFGALHSLSKASEESDNRHRKNFDNVNTRDRACIPADNVCHSCDKVGFIAKDICHYNESSRESGIATLPESLTEDNNIEDYLAYILLKTDSDTSIGDTKNLTRPQLDNNKDTSSDYCTCTEGSEDANLLEQNIFEISSSIGSDKSGSSLQTNSKGSDEYLSCMSVSEIYRYTDTEEGVVLFEKRLLLPSIINNQNESVRSNLTRSSKLSSLPGSFDYDTDLLRKELKNFGYESGPITKTTKRVYLRKLYHLKKCPQVTHKEHIVRKAYSNEVEKTLLDPNWSADVTPLKKLEIELTKEFSNPDPTRRWREGLNKSSFTYLLLDPRMTKNLPCRSETLTQTEVWETFLSSVFYVGKGKRSRPYSHLYDAISNYNKGNFITGSDKLNRILNIWQGNQGVICLHVFQNVLPVEAYTREAAMISALKLENLTNVRTGDFYGMAATWTKHQKNSLGVLLLFKAMKIFLNEGERQLSPHDID